MVKRQLALLLAGIGILTVGISTPVSAEEYEPAGYHVYDVQEEESTDTGMELPEVITFRQELQR